MRKLPFEQDGCIPAHLCPEPNLQPIKLITVINFLFKYNFIEQVDKVE